MQSIIDYLEQLDLSDIESKLYLALLESGPTTIRELAEAIKIKRTTAYFHVDLLIEKGLVIKIVKGAKKQVAANEPAESLKHLIEEKMKSAKTMQTQFPTMLKDITAAYPEFKSVDEAEIRYYKGKSGVKKIYTEALQSKELRTYFNIELIKETLPDNEMMFVEALKSNNAIKIYELFQDTPLSKKQLYEFQTIQVNNGNYFYKFLPPEVSLSAADILIYDGQVAIINTHNQISGVILQNEAYYNNSKELFDLVWKILPDTKKLT